MTRWVVVQVSAGGRRVGESHPRAWLSDDQVDDIRALREDCGWSLGRIARWTGVPKPTVQSLCDYRRRATTPARYVRVVLS
jgi:hypothetical protein